MSNLLFAVVAHTVQLVVAIMTRVCVGSDKLSDVSSLSDHLVSPRTDRLTDRLSDQAASNHRLSSVISRFSPSQPS